MTDVVVTGVGAVAASGAGFDALRAALEAGALPEVEVDASGGHHRAAPHPRGGEAARRAHLVPADATRAWIAPMKSRRMSPPSRFAVAAARLALAEAGLLGEAPGASSAAAGIEPARLGVALGTAFGSTTITKKILDQCVEPGPEAISPFLFTESVANAHAGQVALEVGARGPNATITQGEASASLAVARAASYLVSGRADAVLAGGVDEASPLLHAILDRLGALARGPGAEVARPFDRRRAGFMLSEGAVVLVLERADTARLRGARPLARLAGWARGFDPSARPGGWGTGAAALARRAAAGLERSGVDSRRLGGVVSGASGAVGGDALEAHVLRELCAGGLPPVLAPKATLGEFGGLTLAAALHAALGGALGAADGTFEEDPALGITPARSVGAGPVLLTSLASGGPAAWLAWEGAREA